MTDDELAVGLRRVIAFCRTKLGNYSIRNDRTGVKEEFEHTLLVAEECLGRVEGIMPSPHVEAIAQPDSGRQWWMRD